MSQYPLSPDQVHSILSYLDLPPSDILPLPPIPLLTQHISNLPPSLLQHFTFLTPKQLTSIPTVKHRRLLYATSTPTPSILSVSQGRLRWPLLWERLGGDPLSAINENSQSAIEEEQWVSEGFMNDPNSDREKNQQVKKLGGFLRVLEEERESENVRIAKRMERRLENQGEEFDDSDEDEDESVSFNGKSGQDGRGDRIEVKENQEEVERVFGKRILEIFLDGMDTIDYTSIDFLEPPGGDPIALQDEEDRYFDDEEPSRTPNGHDQGAGQESSVRSRLNEDGKQTQNGQGEYDY
ncbi:hypothetical protein L486_03443 [Kwoniella mangroviensis CBS 10435]|uniref:CCD97-like C-terminal domain-containing protein n=1 Tax=Kwoniella mangroviensis CBS 10435 TaxID=1331196 RepID=A0A1B9ITS6_9TREE|nr:uncharacterized protein I203_02130 [Kwoniella mangroviensis CBS 8507]OCF58948.1 hypothetical protein L486_03443 [Kwoniella mangroviensis CBS 10435]OCF68742.1 hypothetical protein I203_02130 [Kwoniella mangroviensis CBS 8507]OCF76798.1 hypothetical protein I204_02502 [Kwoniella mangroviensis CBS 8886]